jgi:hypothetical protein
LRGGPAQANVRAMSAAPPDPRQTYEAARAAALADRAGARRRETALVWARLAVLVLGVALAYETCERRTVPPAALWVPVAVFVGLSLLVGRAVRRARVADETVAYYEGGLARLDERPAPGAPTGEAHADEGHLYAADLDLFGPGSLFQRLCLARTSAGQQTLAAWLKGPASAETVAARQEAVAELRDQPALRLELWRGAGAVAEDLHADRLRAWLEAPARPVPAGARALGLALALAMAAALGAVALGGPWWPIAPIALAQAWFARRHGALSAATIPIVNHRADELRALGTLARVVEPRALRSARLRALHAALRGQGDRPASAAIAALERLVSWLESRRNPFFALLSAPFLLGTQLALRIEAWRQRHAADVRRWGEALGELEALASLATVAYEHPDRPFAEVLPPGEAPLVEGEGLGHPLIPARTRVVNDLRLGGETRLWLVTGSNMSGKSTWLRTIGVNVVLALAGAPVCARSMRLTPLSIGATLRTSDSLQAGVSRFFAEITRLRDVVALAAGSAHTLFLLDEILHGTNSQDRRAGGEAVIRRLLDHGAVGLVTTHDLALAELADALAPMATNVHFEDRIEDDRLSFDYRLRPGVVTRSNALALMKMVGL